MPKIAAVMSSPMIGSARGVAEPHANCAEEHSQTCPPVDARVVSVRDQRGTIDLAADANPEDRDSLVTEKADNRGRHHRPQIRYVLGMQEPLDTLVSRDDSACENCKHDCYAG